VTGAQHVCACQVDEPTPAMTQNNLGNALSSLGEMANDPKRIEEAVAAYRNALEVRTRDEMPADWAGTNYRLGRALSNLGSSADNVDALKQAVAAFRNEQEIYTREDDAGGWAVTQSSIAHALLLIGKLQSEQAPLEEALAAINDCIEIAPDDEDYKDTLQQIEAGIDELNNTENSDSSET
jgi:tetratricopeptide (TPR) repeat protein